MGLTSVVVAVEADADVALDKRDTVDEMECRRWSASDSSGAASGGAQSCSAGSSGCNCGGGVIRLRREERGVAVCDAKGFSAGASLADLCRPPSRGVGVGVRDKSFADEIGTRRLRCQCEADEPPSPLAREGALLPCASPSDGLRALHGPSASLSSVRLRVHTGRSAVDGTAAPTLLCEPSSQ